MPSHIYAIGDIHGRDDLIEILHNRIQAHHNAWHSGANAQIIHLGDYIDGGPDSRQVIDRLMKGLPGFGFICLKGNHEELMLNCLETDDRQTWRNWLNNGGENTLASFDISFRFGDYDPQQLAEALGQDRISWLKSLILYHKTDDFLFVHAGIRPGIPLEKQSEKDLLWIRSHFLESQEDFGYRIIHGHTPTNEPAVRPNRIGIDTGARSNGRLTAVLLDGGKEPQFLFAPS